MKNYQVRVYDVLDSTQLEAKRLIKSGQAAAGMVVQAAQQTHGRGRFNRPWVSDKGNLYATLILQKPIDAQQCGHYSFITALAVFDTVAHYLPPQVVRLKWPNDVLVAGQKISGILLEVEDDWLLIGVGLNIASAPEYAACLGDGANAEQVLRLLLDHFMAWQVRYGLGGFAFIREAWLGHATGVGLPLQVQLPQGPICGVFKGLDDQGALLLELADGTTKPLYAGEVF